MRKLIDGILEPRARQGIEFLDDNLAQQHAAAETDINTIVNRWLKTGEPPIPKYTAAQYGEYEDIQDFHSAWNVVTRARDNFMAMPAELRNRFDNSPQKFLEFCENPENQEEMIRLKLANRRQLNENQNVRESNNETVNRNTGEIRNESESNTRNTKNENIPSKL